tara:strand:+ start:604 stop:831 length:228 start_codon:yes stop_codon:yes gene_type:complete
MTYHYQPEQEYESAKLERILKELQSIIKRENKRHMMDEHLTHSMRDLLEYEIIPLLEAEVNYDPTPQTSYDFFHQ